MHTTLKLNFILKNWQFVTREFYFGIKTKRYHLIPFGNFSLYIIKTVYNL